MLEGYLRGDLSTVTFGEGGDVRLLKRRADGWVTIAEHEHRLELRPSFTQAHNLLNLLAAVAAAVAVGVRPDGPLEVRFSAMRGTRTPLAGSVLLLDDCYNANPMSMRAAIEDLAETATGRSAAVLGDMLELGPDAPRMHRELARQLNSSGVSLLVTVGPLAGEMAGVFTGECHPAADAQAAAELVVGLLRDGDTVLVKGSRGVGLERVVEKIRGARAPGEELAQDAQALPAGVGPGRR